MAAQCLVYTVIDAHAASFGIYRMNPQPSARVLALLPQDIWSRICRDTGTPGGRPAVRARIARCFLFERLSGLPADTAVFAGGNDEFAAKTTDFPATSPPNLTRHCSTATTFSPATASTTSPSCGSHPRRCWMG